MSRRQRAAISRARRTTVGEVAAYSQVLADSGGHQGVGVGAGVPAWHYLDTGPALAQRGLKPVGTILAVHGNPTWSYLWRDLLPVSIAAAEAGAAPWRVIAVDQLEMGFSARTHAHRTLAGRVRDLDRFTASLGLTGPVCVLGHDWGGVVALGWALDHPEHLAGIALLNTAISQPDGEPLPAPLRAATAGPVLPLATRSTTAFLETTLSLAHGGLPRDVADAYRAPYRDVSRRHGIEAFVADIPASPGHPSHAELHRIATGLRRLRVPALMLWGPGDPIFSDRYLDDLIARLPQARVHRFEDAGHLIAEDVPWAPVMVDWLARELGSTPVTAEAFDGVGNVSDAEDVEDLPVAGYRPMWAALRERAEEATPAVLDPSGDAVRSLSWRQLASAVRDVAAGLHAIGVRPGDRVSLLVSPGPTLTTLVYACLRLGAIAVVADAGLGARGLTRAQRGAHPAWLVGQTKGLIAARVLGWPGVRIAAEPLSAAAAGALGVAHHLADLERAGDHEALPPEPQPSDEAAILFTSGSTGPAKGVVYTHAQLAALRDVLTEHFEILTDAETETPLITGFAPFALLGPALGTRSATPRMDVSRPRTLTARAVADAVRAAGPGMVFLSPAAILNVVATAGDLDPSDREVLAGVRTLLSAGAPIGPDLLTSLTEVMPRARAHTPYGMTECLLVTDITLEGLRQAGAAPEDGVCVGEPIGATQVRVSPLDPSGAATGAPSSQAGVLGEVLINAPHLKERYHRLWLTDVEAERDVPPRWHRTGDIGHLDSRGRLWIEGRLTHVLHTAGGPLAPVGTEQRVERIPKVRRAAVVGVGPAGAQQVVVVVEPRDPIRRCGPAPGSLVDAVRAAARVPVAAVLLVQAMPTDVRHNSKIDRTRLARWSARVLAGGRVGRP